MQQHEPSKWRTDLIIFSETQLDLLTDLNCTVNNRRTTDTDLPMCCLILHVPIKKRKLQVYKSTDLYEHLLSRLNIFSDDSSNLLPFYSTLKLSLEKYDYTDSILMAFDGYSYFKSAGYDYLISSDIDVFLTPFFAQWLSFDCNSFIVSRGGYQDDFNFKRLNRIANNIGLGYGGRQNLGSTW